MSGKMREGIATILTCLPLLWASPWAAVRAAEPAPASRPVTRPTGGSPLARGIELFEARRHAEALVELKKEIFSRPHSVKAYLYAALAAEGIGDWDAAAGFWQDHGLLVTDPAERHRAQLRRALCLQRLGRATSLPATQRLQLRRPPPLVLTAEQLEQFAVHEPAPTTVRNDSFVVTAHNRALGEVIAQRCSLYLRQISAWLLGGRLWPHVTEVVVHRDRKAYLATGAVAHWSSGGFVFRRDPDGTATRRVDVFQVDGAGRFQPRLLSVVLPHELCHVVVTEYFGDREPPLWLNEGLAMLSEDVDPLWRQRPLLGPLQEGTAKRWKWLFAQQQVRRQDVAEFYAQAASVTRFLLEHLEVAQFQALLSELKGGQDSFSALSRAISATGAQPLASLESQWRAKTLRKLTETADERSVRAPAPAPGSRPQSSPAP
jgi:hypothetical protein